MKKTLIFFSLFVIIVFNTCTENPINGDDNIPPGRRDYVWELDTLSKITPNDYSELWGTGPDNLWIATDSWDLDKNLLHFDGTGWTKVQTVPRPIQALSLFGLDVNTAWVGGLNADFWKYNGQTFELYNSYPLQEYLNIFVNDIWGNGADNLYAVGSAASLDTQHLYSFIMKFDGSDWRYILTPSREENFFKIMSSTNLIPNILILSYKNKPNSNSSYRVYSYSNNNFNELLNNVDNPGDIPWFEKLGSDVYLCYEKKLYSINNNQIKMVKNLSATIIKHSKFFGRSVNDIFFTAEEGIAHYNGTDVQVVYPINDFIGIVKMILFNNSVAILLSDYTSFYVLRGKLN